MITIKASFSISVVSVTKSPSFEYNLEVTREQNESEALTEILESLKDSLTTGANTVMSARAAKEI